MKIRFRHATDSSVTSGGWYVNNVVIKWGISYTTTSKPPGKIFNNLLVTKSSGNLVLT